METEIFEQQLEVGEMIGEEVIEKKDAVPRSSSCKQQNSEMVLGAGIKGYGWVVSYWIRLAWARTSQSLQQGNTQYLKNGASCAFLIYTHVTKNWMSWCGEQDTVWCMPVAFSCSYLCRRQQDSVVLGRSNSSGSINTWLNSRHASLTSTIVTTQRFIGIICPAHGSNDFSLRSPIRGYRLPWQHKVTSREEEIIQGFVAETETRPEYGFPKRYRGYWGMELCQRVYQCDRMDL